MSNFMSTISPEAQARIDRTADDIEPVLDIVETHPEPEVEDNDPEPEW